MEIPKSKQQAEYEFRAQSVLELFARLNEPEQIAVHEYAMEMYLEMGREKACADMERSAKIK